MKLITRNHVLSSVLFLILSFLLSANSTFAETKTFIKEYTFHAGDEDSKNSCRVIALREVKRLLLEELGTYLESTTEVQNFRITKDQITTLTAGIVQTELIEEKWDGKTYWLKTKITADSDGVIKSIDALRKDRQKIKELEEIRKLTDDLLKENEMLRKELATAKGEKREGEKSAYSKNIKNLSALEWYEKGYALYTLGNYQGAINAYSKAIELAPQYALFYTQRGGALYYMGNHDQSIVDYNKALELNTNDAIVYALRGISYEKLGNHNQAIKDFNKAIELDPNDSGAYSSRGNTYVVLGNHNQAITDFNRALELNPKDAYTYGVRGLTYSKLNDYNQAIKDYDTVVKLDPTNAIVYALRGIAYRKLGNYNKAIDDYSIAIELNPKFTDAYISRGKIYETLGKRNEAIKDIQVAARLGNKDAQNYLRNNKIGW